MAQDAFIRLVGAPVVFDGAVIPIDGLGDALGWMRASSMTDARKELDDRAWGNDGLPLSVVGTSLWAKEPKRTAIDAPVCPDGRGIRAHANRSSRSGAQNVIVRDVPPTFSDPCGKVITWSS